MRQPSETPSITTRFTALRAEIARQENLCHRVAGSVTMIAVSKTHPSDTIRPLLELGHLDYGENRVQEALGKWPVLKQEYPRIRLHLIGPLQTNKAAAAVGLFDVIQTLDRPKLANRLAAEMVAQKRNPALLIQVNIGEETQKSGIRPDKLAEFLDYCQKQAGLVIRGLMCIPPARSETGMYFALLRQLAQRHELGVLSMGMSADYQEAVKFGADWIRIGASLFGPRAQPSEKIAPANHAQ